MKRQCCPGREEICPCFSQWAIGDRLIKITLFAKWFFWLHGHEWNWMFWVAAILQKQDIKKKIASSRWTPP